MGSYPRREKAEREARERAAMQRALDCQACGALTPGARFRYCGDRLICEACNQQNPQSRVRTMQRELLAPRDICLNVIQPSGCTVQAMAADYRTSLGPFVPVQSQYPEPEPEEELPEMPLVFPSPVVEAPSPLTLVHSTHEPKQEALLLVADRP